MLPSPVHAALLGGRPQVGWQPCSLLGVPARCTWLQAAAASSDCLCGPGARGPPPEAHASSLLEGTFLRQRSGCACAGPPRQVMRHLSGKFSRRPSITDPHNKTFHKVWAPCCQRLHLNCACADVRPAEALRAAHPSAAARACCRRLCTGVMIPSAIAGQLLPAQEAIHN